MSPQHAILKSSLAGLAVGLFILVGLGLVPVQPICKPGAECPPFTGFDALSSRARGLAETWPAAVGVLAVCAVVGGAVGAWRGRASSVVN